MIYNRKIVDQFLEALDLPPRFGLVNRDAPVNINDIENCVMTVDCGAEVKWGMSKLIIESIKLPNVVIKIPFNGYYSKNMEWTPFKWAPGSDPANYCLAEFEKYKRLKTYSLDCFVAATAQYANDAYIQEYIEPEGDFFISQKPSEDSYKIAEEWYYEGKVEINPEWWGNCIDYYGKSKVKRFLEYCENIDLDIVEDVHEQNYGYRPDGSPCILDYSNFLDY